MVKSTWDKRTVEAAKPLNACMASANKSLTLQVAVHSLYFVITSAYGHDKN